VDSNPLLHQPQVLRRKKGRLPRQRCRIGQVIGCDSYSISTPVGASILANKCTWDDAICRIFFGREGPREIGLTVMFKAGTSQRLNPNNPAGAAAVQIAPVIGTLGVPQGPHGLATTGLETAALVAFRAPANDLSKLSAFTFYQIGFVFDQALLVNG